MIFLFYIFAQRVLFLFLWAYGCCALKMLCQKLTASNSTSCPSLCSWQLLALKLLLQDGAYFGWLFFFKLCPLNIYSSSFLRSRGWGIHQYLLKLWRCELNHGPCGTAEWTGADDNHCDFFSSCFLINIVVLKHYRRGLGPQTKNRVQYFAFLCH